MDVSGFISTIESAGSILKPFLNVLIFIAKFLFLTPWGWIIIVIAFISMVIVRVKNKNNEVTFYSFIGGISESLFWLYSNVTTIIIGLFIIFAVSTIFVGFTEFGESLRLFNDVKTMEAALKNLSGERKVLEIQSTPVEVGGVQQINVVATYYAYSPVQGEDVETGQRVYTVDGSRLYVDFGVINFEYTLIENGDKYNIAFPNKIYSESVAYDSGVNIFAESESVPLTFDLDEGDIYLMSETDFEDKMIEIIESATNDIKAKEMGLRTFYGQSIAVTPVEGKIYTFYSTGAGGMIVE